MPAEAIIGGVGSLVGGAMQADAADDAASMQLQATREANALHEKLYNQQRQDQQPWRAAGLTALGQMNNPDFQRDFTADDFKQDPGYEFRMAEGQKALERSASARGGLFSGAAGKALSRYGQDFASNEYGNAYNRFNADRDRRFGRLSSLAGIGQGATNQLISGAQNYANQGSQNIIGGGNAQAAGRIGQANAWSGAISGITKAGMDAGAASQQNSWMERMLKAQGA